jgi:hypothetical protein
VDKPAAAPLVYPYARATMLYGCLYEPVSAFTLYPYIYGLTRTMRPYGPSGGFFCGFYRVIGATVAAGHWHGEAYSLPDGIQLFAYFVVKYEFSAATLTA